MFINLGHTQTITGITVQPANNNSITVYTHIELRYVGRIYGHQIGVSNDTIFIKICSGEGAEGTITPVTDTTTVTIDPLLSHYFLSVKGYSANYTNGNCDYINIYDSVFHEFYTPVTDSTRFLSVAELSPKDDVVLYPNPAHDEISISGNCTTCDQVYIVNTMGHKVYQARYDHNRLAVNISSFTNGPYFLCFKNRYGQVLNTRQFSKEQ